MDESHSIEPTASVPGVGSRRGARVFRAACATGLLIALSALCTASAQQESAASYTNPVVTPVAADPSLIRAEDDAFYLYATQDKWEGVEHYVPIFRSYDLVDWEYLGDAFPWPPGWKKGGGFYWAPDISRVGDTYRLYYSASLWGDSNPCIGLATSSSPEGPWSDLGRAVFCSDDIGVPNSIDPFVWYRDDGPATMIWGSFHGIWAVALSEDGTAAVGEKVQLADTRFEAPYVIERNGLYYLFLSAGSCCAGADSTYQTYVGRSERLLGPYLDADGRDLLFGGGTLVLDANETWVGPGHNGIVRDDEGQDWIVYHAIPRDDPRLLNTVNRRPVLIDRIEWVDGWPVVNGGGGPSDAPQPAPAIDLQ